MNGTLFMATFKRNWLLMLIFGCVLLMYMTVMISMFDPDDMEALTAMLDLMPEDMMNAMGFSGVVTDLTGFLASWLYGLLMVGFPLVYSVILGNRLVAKMVDDGSFSYLLSTPHARMTILITQGVYALVSLAVMFAVLFAVGVMTCSAIFPGLLDVWAFLRLNVTTLLVNMLVLMIVFFFSCLFNESRNAIAFGAGIPVLFLLMKMLGGASADAEVLKNVSIYGFYDPVALVGGSSAILPNLVYVFGILVLFASGVVVFNKKHLPL